MQRRRRPPGERRREGRGTGGMGRGRTESPIRRLSLSGASVFTPPRPRKVVKREYDAGKARARAGALAIGSLLLFSPRRLCERPAKRGALALLANMIIPSAEKRGRKAALIFLRRHSHCPLYSALFSRSLSGITRVRLYYRQRRRGTPVRSSLGRLAASPFSRARLDTRTRYSVRCLPRFYARIILSRNIQATCR